MPRDEEGKKPGPGRPLRGDRKRVRVSFTLHPREAEWLRARAHARKISMSEVLDEAIQESRKRARSPGKTGGPGRSRARIPVPRRKLAEFCRRHHIRSLALFGSVLTDRFGPDSDVDVLVEFEDGREPGFFDLAAMEDECGRLLGGRKVDLRSRGEISRHFRESVVRDAEVVYGA